MNKKIKAITDALVCAALCCSLMLLGVVPTAAQTNNQSSATLDEGAQGVKNQIVQIGERGDITIVGKNKREFYGSVREIKDESVSIDEIDQNAIVEIKYQDIKKIRKGYGSSKNRFGNRIPTHRNIIAIAALTGLILLPIILLANAKD